MSEQLSWDIIDKPEDVASAVLGVLVKWDSPIFDEIQALEVRQITKPPMPTVELELQEVVNIIGLSLEYAGRVYRRIGPTIHRKPRNEPLAVREVVGGR